MTPPAVPSVRAPRPGGLPAGVRYGALVALVVATCVSIVSMFETSFMSDPDAVRRSLEHAAARAPGDQDAGLLFWRTYFEALFAHRDLRMLLLLGQLFSAAFVMGSAVRLLRPRGLPREGMRRLVTSSVLVTAVLRTVDGAQSSVAVGRAIRAATPALIAQLAKTNPAAAERGTEVMLRLLALGLSGALTVAVVGSLLALATYFRSARVREAVLAEDLRAERG